MHVYVHITGAVIPADQAERNGSLSVEGPPPSQGVEHLKLVTIIVMIYN